MKDSCQSSCQSVAVSVFGWVLQRKNRCISANKKSQKHRLVYWSHLFFFIIIILFQSCIAASSATSIPGYRASCRRGKAALQSLYLDSAKFHFFLAYKKGMPVDSLYYFLAEIYMARHTYDSALALNYAIGKSESNSFEMRILKQRYFIYSGLGWGKMAETVLDSMKQLTSYRAIGLVPQISFKIGTGYKYEKQTVDTVLPWGIENYDASDGILYKTECNLRWELPLLPKNRFHTGVGIKAEKPYWTGSDVEVMDSVSFSAQAFFGVDNIFDHISMGYDNKYKRYYNKSNVFGHSLNLSYSMYSHTTLWFLTGFYSIDFDNEYKLDNQTFSIMSYNDLFLQKKWGVNLLFSVMGYFANAMSEHFYSDTIYALYIYHVETKGNQVEYYTDNTFTNKLDTTGLLWTSFSSMLHNSANEEYMTRVTPQKHLSYNATISYNRELFKKIIGRIGLQWQLSHYLKEYEWISCDRTTFRKLKTKKILALDKDDKQYYYFNDPPHIYPIDTKNIVEDISNETAVLVYHNKKRVDSFLGLNLSLEREFHRIGTLSIRGNLGKTWSTLKEDSPFEIQDYYGAVSCQWNKKFSHSLR